jgi:hypothetical protein
VLPFSRDANKLFDGLRLRYLVEGEISEPLEEINYEQMGGAM